MVPVPDTSSEAAWPACSPEIPGLSLVLAAALWLIGGLEAVAGTFARMEVGRAARHPVSVVEADIFVQKSRTVMRLRCFADELELLHGVEPLPDGTYDLEELRETTVEHGQYLADRIQLIDSAGAVLSGKITEVVHLEPPPGGLRAGQLMNCFLGYELEYEYDSPPDFLTVRQLLVGARYVLPSELRVMVRQAGSETPWAQMVKPEQPETFRFDWERPVLAEDAPEEDWQAWFDRQRESVLGITSYSSVYSFIYITPVEVRHEILIPLACLATLLPIERADPMLLEIDEQDRIAADIGRFLASASSVRINGGAVPARQDRIDFYALDLRDFAVQSERRRISMANGRVGLILSYPTRVPPAEVDVEWNLFNDAVQNVESVIFIGNRVERTRFSRYLASNVWNWTAGNGEGFPPTVVRAVNAGELPKRAPWPVPVLTVAAWLMAGALLVFRSRWSGPRRVLLVAALIAAGWLCRPLASVPLPLDRGLLPVSSATADSVFFQLHQNLFRAFDFPGESECYDALSQSVDGPLLNQLYLQIRNSLRIREQGGAVARIDEAVIDEGALEGPGDAATGRGFLYRCRWRLAGTVEHWGHVHQRTNLYEARFQVSLRDGCWKITRFEPIDEQQGQVRTSLRQF